MSIIHDALKKAQQAQDLKTDTIPPQKKPDQLFSTPSGPATPAEEQPVEHLPPTQNKARSILALICAIAIISGSCIFAYKQLCVYFPKFKDFAESSFDALIHKKKEPDFKTKSPESLVPLAKITVNPPKIVAPSVAAKSSLPTNVAPAAAATTPVVTTPPAPQTLNIHGVMANGSGNLVLINDQVYQEGDDVDGVKIVKIDLDSIKVINNGKEETIRVKQ